MNNYDPRAHGAKCDECPLKGSTVVPPESGPNDLEILAGRAVAVVGEAPGEGEERQHRPFVGPSGEELNKALRGAQLKRSGVHVTNVLLCRPPGNKLKDLMTRINKYNKQQEKLHKEKKKAAEKAGEPPPVNPPDRIASPIDCCAPRFQDEIINYKNFITLGKTALNAVTGITASILAVRGGLTELNATERTPERRVMPTIHPAFCLRMPRWLHVFRNDVHKAGRWFRGEADWVPPNVTYQPDPVTLQNFLARDTIFTFDIETDGIECLTAKMRCIAIGDENDVMVMGFLSKDGQRKFYSDLEEIPIRAILYEFFEDETRVKAGHNAGYYDKIILQQQWGIDPKPIIDTILLHRCVESELPHGLAYVGSMYTEAPAWKCYDPETEVLTPRGWVRFDKLERGVPVAQWDKGIVEFTLPSAYVDQPYKGKMWKLSNQATDLLVSPDHKMVYRSKHSDALRECVVQDLPKTGKLPHVGVLSGWREEGMAFVQLLAALQADGSWAWKSEKDTVPAYLDFGFTKQRKIERLKGILDTLGMAYSEKHTGTVNPRTRIWVNSHPNVEQLWKRLGPEKRFGHWLLWWTPLLRRVLLDELPLWDGTKGAEHTNYNTSDELNADWVQACAVSTGRAARKYEYDDGMFRVSLPSGKERSREWSKLEGLKREQVDYDGRILCVSVPSGFLLVRRNGKVTVSGNTDREGHKLSHDSETDAQLHEYCANDVAVTARVLNPLVDQVRLRAQVSVWQLDQKIQAVCADMHTVGMFVDQDVRLEKEKELLARRFSLLADIRDRLQRPDFNPGSVYQVRDVLFATWKLEPPLDEEDRYTASGDPSTADLVLRSLLTDRSVPDEQREVIKLFRYYRKVQKVLGTYVVKLRPWNMSADLGWDDEDDWVDKETRERYGQVKRGIVDPQTGRMHPGYNAHVAVCVDPSTWILTGKGPRQIGNLGGFGPAQSERPTEGLRLHDGSHFNEVSHLQNPGKCPTLTATTVLGLRLTGTPHHRVQVASKKKFLRQTADGKWHPTEPEAVWCRLDALKSGEYVRVPVGMNAWSETIPALPQTERLSPRTNANDVWLPSKLDAALAFFTGAYNADGSLHDANGSFSIRINNRKEKHTVFQAAEALFGPDAVSLQEWGVAITSISLGPWCEAMGFGRRIENKKAPDWILGAPRDFVQSYLVGLAFDSSMGVNGGTTPWWRYTGTKELAQEVQMFLLNFGIPAGLRDASTRKQPQTWTLTITGQADVEAVCALTYQQPPPTPSLEGDQSQRRPKYIRRGNTLWLRVKEVEDTGVRAVLDVTIPCGHMFWANGTVSHNTGRLSSSKPINAQNFPKLMRGMVIAAPGNILVGADMDQLELRIAAARWDVGLYLRAFEDGKDPHSMTAFAVFGDRFLTAAGLTAGQFSHPGPLVGTSYDEHGKFIGTGEDKKMRDLSKAVQYASQYMATVETVHKLIQKTEVPAKDANGDKVTDGTTDLPYALLPLKKVRKMRDNWLKGAPEFEKGWETEIASYRAHGYIKEPVTERRRDFLDGENPNEIVNFPIQASAAGLMNRAILELAEAIPLNKWGPGTGIINQCHDSIVVECPEDQAEYVASLLEECMNQTHPDLPGVTFTASATTGRTWKEVG